MEKVLITGGGGFIGFHLAGKLAKEGLHVDILDDFSRAVKDSDLENLLEKPNVHCINCDLTDSKCITALEDNYKFIFHLAAIIGVQHVLKKPYDVLTKNITMLANVLSIAKRQSELKRFVYTSTSEVYAGTLKYFDLPIPTAENTPLALTDTLEPRTSYMLSKIYGEAMCQHSNLPYTIVRPHNVYGPRMGMSHVIPELLQRALSTKNGENLTVYSVSHKRTFCFIEDAVELLTQIIQHESCINITLNLGSQEPEVTIGEVAKIVLDTVGRNISIIPGPVTAGSPVRRAPDMSLALALTGFEATTGLNEGIAQTYHWYNTNVFQSNGITAK